MNSPIRQSVFYFQLSCFSEQFLKCPAGPNRFCAPRLYRQGPSLQYSSMPHQVHMLPPPRSNRCLTINSVLSGVPWNRAWKSLYRNLSRFDRTLPKKNDKMQKVLPVLSLCLTLIQQDYKQIFVRRNTAPYSIFAPSNQAFHLDVLLLSTRARMQE